MPKETEKKPSKFVFHYRNSETGEYVTKAYAQEHPKTTQRIKSLRAMWHGAEDLHKKSYPAPDEAES